MDEFAYLFWECEEPMFEHNRKMAPYKMAVHHFRGLDQTIGIGHREFLLERAEAVKVLDMYRPEIDKCVAIDESCKYP